MKIEYQYLAECFRTCTQPKYLAQLQFVLNQLGDEPSTVSHASLERLAKFPTSFMLLAWDRDKDLIVGHAILVLSCLSDQLSAHLEEVCVHPEYRRLSIGKRLVVQLLLLAKMRGVAECELTSAPHRAEAGHLYEELGFTQLTTRVYVLDALQQWQAPKMLRQA